MLKLLKQHLRQRRLRRHRILDLPAANARVLGNWAVWPTGLNSQSVVYSFGVGANVAWDLAMIGAYGATVHAFDPTPASIAWVREQSLPPQFVFHDVGISNFDGWLDFYPPRKTGGFHYTQERSRGSCSAAPIHGKVQRLATIARELGHPGIDVLKLDIEGSEFDAIPDILASGIAIGQLLVEIHYQFPSRSFREGLALIATIKRAGFQCFWMSTRGYEFGFVHESQLTSRP